MADARFAKPLDQDLILDLFSSHELLVTIEEGATGGFGALVLHFLAAKGMLDGRCDIRTMTLPDKFIAQAAPRDMYDEAGLNAAQIAETVRNALSRKPTDTRRLHAIPGNRENYVQLAHRAEDR